WMSGLSLHDALTISVGGPVYDHAGKGAYGGGKLCAPGTAAGKGGIGGYDEAVHPAVPERLHRPQLLVGVETAGGKEYTHVRPLRSEEHTSELQSREK